MPSLHFKAEILIHDANPYVLVKAAQARTLKPGWKRPMPVLIKINGRPDRPWRINMMPIGDGDFYLYLHGDVRKASGTKVGDTVDVEVSFDDEYRNGPQHPMPEWFARAIEKDRKAKTNWEALIPSRKKEILRYFARLRSQEAIDRNLRKVMQVLAGQPGRFMARDWENGK